MLVDLAIVKQVSIETAQGVWLTIPELLATLKERYPTLTESKLERTLYEMHRHGLIDKRRRVKFEITPGAAPNEWGG